MLECVEECHGAYPFSNRTVAYPYSPQFSAALSTRVPQHPKPQTLSNASQPYLTMLIRTAVDIRSYRWAAMSWHWAGRCSYHWAAAFAP